MRAWRSRCRSYSAASLQVRLCVADGGLYNSNLLRPETALERGKLPCVGLSRERGMRKSRAIYPHIASQSDFSDIAPEREAGRGRSIGLINCSLWSLGQVDARRGYGVRRGRRLLWCQTCGSGP